MYARVFSIGSGPRASVLGWVTYEANRGPKLHIQSTFHIRTIYGIIHFIYQFLNLKLGHYTFSHHIYLF